MLDPVSSALARPPSPSATAHALPLRQASRRSPRRIRKARKGGTWVEAAISNARGRGAVVSAELSAYAVRTQVHLGLTRRSLIPGPFRPGFRTCRTHRLHLCFVSGHARQVCRDISASISSSPSPTWAQLSISRPRLLARPHQRRSEASLIRCETLDAETAARRTVAAVPAPTPRGVGIGYSPR
jgi:hypothetical protein